MATELGQAYVQIMPSAQGISGSIQKALDPEASAAGKSAGSKIASSIASSMGKAGKTLTKAITVPAMGAAAAVGGVVAAFGWKRLVGLDSARAQLQGLGYDAEAVDRISTQVKDAIQGTVTTMAEGVSVAAGGLAAGVKEGAELERYIKLVGDAAVGANRPVSDMATIFNRVQGMGKLMTQELNMIEDGMPGFSLAMSKSLGVTQEEFRKMVTAGEVSSDQFLNVMDGFAGKMSDAYANSWQGMVSNTKANIGIIGESILGGVFEQSKESIAEFLEYLRSDDVKEWAKQVGETLGNAFTTMIESIKGAIEWWTGLDGSTKKLILTFAGVAVAIGPILMILSKITTTIMSLVPLFKVLGTAIGLITSPVGLVVAAIVGAAVLIMVYWEPIKEFFIGLWNSIKGAGLLIWENLKEGWQNAKENLQEAWESIKEFFTNLWTSVKEIFSTSWNAIVSVVTTVTNSIKSGITSGFNAVKSVITTVNNSIKSGISTVWNGIKSVVSSVMNGIRSTVTSIWTGIKNTITGIVNGIKSTISNIFNTLSGIVSGAFNGVKNAVSNGMSAAFNSVTGFFGKFKDAGKNIVSSIADGIKGAIGKVTGAIKNVTQKVRDFLPFSPPKTGPLIDIMDVKWGETIAAGIQKGKNTVAKAMDDVLNEPKYELESTGKVLSDSVRMQSSNLFKRNPSDGDHITNNENNITIHATIREEQDIRKLAKELDDYIKRGGRSKGVVRV